MRAREFTSERPKMGINVRSDGNVDYAGLIVDGRKKYESRQTDSLRPYVGKTVAIVRTGNGPATAIGQVTVGEPIVVNADEFDKMRGKHFVPAGSKFDIAPDASKYLYPMINPVRWNEEKVISNKGIIARKIDEVVINELRGVKQDLVNAPYPDILLQHGFKQIGNGGAAAVWEHPNLDYVLKVFDNKDTAYINWVDVCLQYRNNPCLPKFVSPKIYALNDKLNYIRMEKLTPAATTYGQLCLEIFDAVEKLSTTRDDDEDDNKFNIRDYPSITNYLRKCPSLLNTIRLIAEMIQQGDGGNDVNASNIMLRGDQIVFTDPLRYGW